MWGHSTEPLFTIALAIAHIAKFSLKGSENYEDDAMAATKGV